jgi:hypothetical protein
VVSRKGEDPMPIVRLPIERLEIDQILVRRSEDAERPYTLQVSLVGYDADGAPVHQLLEALTLEAAQAKTMTLHALVQWLTGRVAERLRGAYSG